MQQQEWDCNHGVSYKETWWIPARKLLPAAKPINKKEMLTLADFLLCGDGSSAEEDLVTPEAKNISK